MVLRGGSARGADHEDRGNMDDDDDNDTRPHDCSMEVECIVDGQQQDAAPEGAADVADDEDSVIFLDEDERVDEHWSGEGEGQDALPIIDPNAPNFGEEGYGSSELSRSALHSPPPSSPLSSHLFASPRLSSFPLFFLYALFLSFFLLFSS